MALQEYRGKTATVKVNSMLKSYVTDRLLHF